MLIDGRPARVQSLGGGPVNYIGYGKQKLVRYELDPTIAEEIGVPPQGNVTHELSLDRAALDRLRTAFVARFPNFTAFDSPSDYYDEEDAYKRSIIAEAKRLVREHSEDGEAELGGALLDLVGSKQHNLLGYYKTYHSLAKWRTEHKGKFEAAAGALARSTGASSSAAQSFVDAVWPIIEEGQTSKPYGDSRIFPSLLLALVQPADAIFVRTIPLNNAGTLLLGEKLFGGNPLTAAEYDRTKELAQAVFVIMRDEWMWRPRDLWDVQGFIWVTCQKREVTLASFQSDTDDGMATMIDSTNLILYGPPGTGKTYATAEHAVRLCGEDVPADRDALMAQFRTLSDAGRIEFVTFHQSTAYEEFVEGLRPTQSTDEDVAGFTLQPEPGIFRRIARRAETSTGPGDSGFSISGHQVFKMSIGEAANPDDAYLFEEAIAGGYTLLGFEDIDWSDAKYTNRDAIIEAVRERGVMEGGDPTAMSGRVQMPFIFRNWVKHGDIVVVSKGNSLFRAIGEVIGDYTFSPREGGDYGHRRAVRWLWVDRAGVPVNEIYARNFTMKSIYQLTPADINAPALERYITSQQDAGAGSPEPFVLIIDEINRANISKVFGELITLIEPDKRIGKENGLKVRLPYSGEIFGVPANLHIIGTMNTADRSIALLDTALRRRFEFRELMPDASLLGTVEGIDLQALLATINERIEYLFDREHQIGHAYFMRCRTRCDVDEVMRHKVIPLLAEYFYEDWAKVAAVLGDGDESDGDREGSFIDRRPLKAPKGLNGDEDAAPRYRWSVRDTFSYHGFAAA